MPMSGPRKRDPIIAPSILAADFSRLGDEIRAIEHVIKVWLI